MKKREELWEKLRKRAESLFWRGGMMIIAGLLDVVLENLSLLDLNDGVTVVVGLLLGEISKWVSNNLSRS